MNLDTALVDEIVRRVMEQLPDATASPRPDSPPAVPSNSDSNIGSSGRFLAPAVTLGGVAVAAQVTALGPTLAPQPLPRAVPTTAPVDTAIVTEVLIAERIVTAELLESRLKGARRVRVAARALLTPSAHDVVRTRRLEVIREPAEAPPGARAIARWLVLAHQPVSGLEGAVTAWRGAGAAVANKLANDPADAASIAISAICRGEADNVLVLTSAPEWVACLANRNAQVRAASIADSATIARLKETLRPNVLAFDGARRGSFELAGLFKSLDR